MKCYFAVKLVVSLIIFVNACRYKYKHKPFTSAKRRSRKNTKENIVSPKKKCLLDRNKSSWFTDDEDNTGVHPSLQSASHRKIVSCHESESDTNSESESSNEEDNFEDLNYLWIIDISILKSYIHKTTVCNKCLLKSRYS